MRLTEIEGPAFARDTTIADLLAEMAQETKGDRPGHPFRGNQHVRVASSGGAMSSGPSGTPTGTDAKPSGPYTAGRNARRMAEIRKRVEACGDLTALPPADAVEVTIAGRTGWRNAALSQPLVEAEAAVRAVGTLVHNEALARVAAKVGDEGDITAADIAGTGRIRKEIDATITEQSRLLGERLERERTLESEYAARLGFESYDQAVKIRGASVEARFIEDVLRSDETFQRLKREQEYMMAKTYLLSDKLKTIDAAVTEHYGEAVRTVLGEIRPFGNDRQVEMSPFLVQSARSEFIDKGMSIGAGYTDPGFLSSSRDVAMIRGMVVETQKAFPDAWLDRSMNAGKVSLEVHYDRGRANYRERIGMHADETLGNISFFRHKGGVESTETAGFQQDVLDHEMTHRMEHVNPHLRALEWAFLERRCGGEVPRSLGGGYGDNEVTRPDKFQSAYTGKLYPYEKGGKEYPFAEVLSMGVQSLRSPNTSTIRLWEDRDMAAFVLGTLAAA